VTRRDGIHGSVIDPSLRRYSKQRGLRGILVNARYPKRYPAGKTDVRNASLVRQLHFNGLLRGSFRPTAEIANAAGLICANGNGWSSMRRLHIPLTGRGIALAIPERGDMQKALMEL